MRTTGKPQESKGIRNKRLSVGLDRDVRTGASLNRLPGSSVFDRAAEAETDPNSAEWSPALRTLGGVIPIFRLLSPQIT